MIGITSDAQPARWGAWELPAALVPYHYVESVERAGGRALVVPPSVEGVDETLDVLDGVVFSGGIDIDPGTYGADPHEKRIEIRWRDLDALRHVNNAVYATYLEEARDEWFVRALGPGGNFWDYVLARVAIDFRRELTQDDDALLVRTRLVRIGTSSLTFREDIVSLAGWVAAEAESVVVARDSDIGRSRPLTDAERSALTAVLAAA